MTWQEQGNCLGIDTALFFPSRGEDTSDAKAVCKACDVRNMCLDFALERGEKHGIWGGLSERERRRIRRARRMEVTSTPVRALRAERGVTNLAHAPGGNDAA